MRKTILLLSFFVLAVISITFVYAGSDSSTANFNLLGCSEDYTPVSWCSGSSDYGMPFYCSPDIVPYKLAEKCVICQCPTNTNPWCNPAGTGECSSKPAGLVCEDETADCATYLGVCFFDNSASKCKTCPDQLTNLTDCSFYKDEKSCNEDSCFLGKNGFGVGFYESKYVPVNYSCEWYQPSVQEGGEVSCRLGYTTIDSQGTLSRCKTTQKLSPCVNEIAEMAWTKTCITGGISSKTSGKTSVSCGKAASPLPFFSALNLVIAVSIIFLIYSLAFLRKKGEK